MPFLQSASWTSVDLWSLAVEFPQFGHELEDHLSEIGDSKNVCCVVKLYGSYKCTHVCVINLTARWTWHVVSPVRVGDWPKCLYMVMFCGWNRLVDVWWRLIVFQKLQYVVNFHSTFSETWDIFGTITKIMTKMIKICSSFF